MIHLAIVGLGAWGRRLVESVQGISPDVAFTRAVVRDIERSRPFAEKHGLTLSDDLKAVVQDRAIDGVVSCGPAHMHAHHSLAALEEGKPVLAIKPMALSLEDAQELAAVSKRKGVLLALGYNRCFFPNVLEMRSRLRSGVLGDLLHTEGDFCVDRYGKIPAGDWKADPTHVPAGSLADHMLYLTIETLGPIAQVHAQAYRGISPNALADTTAVLLRTTKDRSALLTAIGVTPDYYRFQVFGTQGWIEIRNATHLTFQPSGGTHETMILPSLDTERVELEAFAAALEGRQKFPVTVDDAVHGVAVLEAMGRSALQGSPVALS